MNQSAAPDQPDATSFATLSPDTVLDALAAQGLYGDGRLLALNSYENRVYQVGMEEGPPLVAKFYRPLRWTDEQILEEHAFSQELADDEVPVVPAMRLENGRTLHRHGGFRFAVFRRHGGRAPELDDADTLERLGRFIGRIHAVGLRQPFVHRPALDQASFGEEPRDWLLAHDFIPMDVATAWRTTVEQALAGVQRCYERAGQIRTLRLHGDCHVGNVLWTDHGPHFVDLDDARMGPAVQDLWMLAPNPRAIDALLDGYADFRDFDRAELALIEPLRVMRQIHYAGWIAQRWADPAFPLAFPFAAEARWWEQHVLDLLEAAERLEDS